MSLIQRTYLWLLFICLFCIPSLAAPPNLIIILADDLGYGDLGCYGHPTIRTPNIDRMAAEGMRLTDFYSSAVVCTPSRAGLLTGRYALRSGMASDLRRVLFPKSTGGFPASEITIADLLKKQGYATAAIGKWHLGHRPPNIPNAHGFDQFFGLLFSNDMEVRAEAPKLPSRSLEPKNEWWNQALWRNTQIVQRPVDQHTLTQAYTRESIDFIRQNKTKPFFIYLAHTFPHVPLFASPAFEKHSARGLYGDVVEEIDWSTGQVLDTLRAEGLADNTLVIFTSDNGPWLIQELAGGSAGLLREGKGSTWEGGMRVPFIAWWPTKIKPAQLNHSLACNLDLFNTAVALAGAEIPKDRPIDGLNMLPLLLATGPSPRTSLVYYRDEQLYAIRKGPWKAHYITKPGYGPEAAVKHDPPLLYNLEQDPSERFDLAAARPEVIADLQKELDLHKAGMVPGKNQLDEWEPPKKK